MKFETEKRINENQSLTIEKEKNKEVISKQNIIDVLLISSLTIFLAGLIYLYFINKRINRKNQLINSQNVVKDKLFSVISHDMRSPLSQAVGMLSILETGDLNLAELAAVAPFVKNDIENTLDMMDNLLVWSKNQLKGFQYSPELFGIRQLADEVLYNLLRQVEKKQINAVNMNAEGHVVYADKEMIRIVLRNLVANAVKFTPVNGAIRLSSEIQDQKIVIIVEDNGVGIKIEDQQKVFSAESYTTIGTANEKGTGLGLQICSDFISLNKGRIWMESSANKGSKFIFSLPSTF